MQHLGSIGLCATATPPSRCSVARGEFRPCGWHPRRRPDRRCPVQPCRVAGGRRV